MSNNKTQLAHQKNFSEKFKNIFKLKDVIFFFKYILVILLSVYGEKILVLFILKKKFFLLSCKWTNTSYSMKTSNETSKYAPKTQFPKVRTLMSLNIIMFKRIRFV